MSFSDISFTIVENDNDYSIANSWGGGDTLPKPATVDELRAFVERFLNQEIDDAVDELMWDFEDDLDEDDDN